MTSWRRTALATALAVVVALALGVWPGAWAAPDRLRWAIPSHDESVQAVVGDVVVLANDSSARLVALSDGRSLGTFPATWRDRFIVAGDRLLVISDGYAMLYDATARRVWPSPVRAERGVAAFDGVTAVERGTEVVAIADDGTVRWTREVELSRQTYRFPIVSRLPADNIYLPAGPPVLPALAPLPVAGRWEFADARGQVRAVADGMYAGVVGETPVTSTLVDGRCDVTVARVHREFDCTFAKPWAMGGVLFFERGTGAMVVPVAGERMAVLHDVALSPGRPGDLLVSDRGMARSHGEFIAGGPLPDYAGVWTYSAQARLTPYVGNGAVAVHGGGRVTVLDARDGAVTGWVGAERVNSVWPVAPGQALVATRDTVALVGATPTAP